jgi:hypothetical protein
MTEGYLKEQNLGEKIDMWVNDGVPARVQEWSDFQKQAFIIERQKDLTDKDILNALVNMFRRIDPERLTDEEKDEYAKIMMDFGLDF